MTEEKKKPGCLWPALWMVVSFLGTVLCAAIVAFMAADSESKGVTAMQLVTAPVGFLWAGSLAAIITYFIKSDSKPLRYGMPFGCGCLGGIVFLFSVFFFFVAIWPSL